MTARKSFVAVLSCLMVLGLFVIPAFADQGTPLKLSAARVSIAGTSNIHPFTASTTDVRMSRLAVAPADGDLLQAAVKPGALDAFEIGALKIGLADHASTPPVAYDIDPLTVAVKNIRNEGTALITLDAALRIAQGGTLRVTGDADPAGTRASAKATLQRLSLKPLQPLVAARTALALSSGEVSAVVSVLTMAPWRMTETSSVIAMISRSLCVMRMMVLPSSRSLRRMRNR